MQFLSGLAEVVLRESRLPKKTPQPEVDRAKVAVIPYLHGFSHRVKKAAARAGVKVVYSAPIKLGSLCRRVNSCDLERPACGKKHANPEVDCEAQVVYEVPTSCGGLYIGQTGRCINDRLREHANNLGAKTGSNLAIHCAQCGCKPLFKRTRIVRRYRDTRAREIYEAFFMHSVGPCCVSSPSVALTDKEINYLRN